MLIFKCLKAVEHTVCVDDGLREGVSSIYLDIKDKYCKNVRSDEI